MGEVVEREPFESRFREAAPSSVSDDGTLVAGDRRMAHAMLVPYDFSAASERALAWAANELREHGGSVHVLHVLNPIPIAAVTVPVVAPPPSQHDIEKMYDAVREAMQRHGLDGEPRVVFAPSPGQAAVRIADELHCDLVVVGTHGRGGLSRAVLGSAADYIVRHAACPVITMRAKES